MLKVTGWEESSNIESDVSHTEVNYPLLLAFLSWDNANYVQGRDRVKNSLTELHQWTPSGHPISVYERET